MDLDFSRCRLVPVPEPDGSFSMSGVKAHAKIGVKVLIDHPYFLLADSMGLMKSAQTIIAAQLLYDRGDIDRVVIVAPGSVRNPVWFDPVMGELAKHLFLQAAIKQYHIKSKVWHYPTEELHGPRLFFLCVNYEYIRTPRHLTEVLAYCTKKTLLILDESSYVRSWKSAQTKACVKIRAKCKYVWELNGTPIMHSPLDIFSQANLLHTSILDCPYITMYKTRYAVQEVVKRRNGSVMLNPKTHQPLLVPTEEWKNLPDLQRRLKPYILRRTLDEITDLPKALPSVGHEVPLSPTTWALYKQMRQQLIARFESGHLSVAVNAAVKVMRLAQLTSGFAGGLQDLFDEDRSLTIEDISTEKLDFVLALSHTWWEMDPCLKIAVLTRHRPELDRLMRVASTALPAHVKTGFIYGGQQPDERTAALHLLDPRTAPIGPVLWAGVYGTGTFGINLTACHTVINSSFIYSPGPMQQVDARFVRPGQTSPVSFHDILATGPNGEPTIDHTILAARRARQDVATWTVSAWHSALVQEAAA